MSMWLDEPDSEALDGLGGGLGLPTYPSADGLGSGDDAPVAEGDEDWSPDQGYPDSSQSVRLWVDADRRLTKVVISNKWRERAKGTSLSSMFDEAFLLATAQLAEESDPWEPPAASAARDPDGVPPLTWDAVLDALREVDVLNAKVEALRAKPDDEVRPNRWVGEETVGASDNRMVQVTLDRYGHTRQVQFNEPWLMQSRVSEVCECVMQAHRQAYAAYQPPTFEPGEHAELALEAQRLSQQTMALMRQGGYR